MSVPEEGLAQMVRGNPGSPVLRPFPPFLGGGLDEGSLDEVTGPVKGGVINTEHRDMWPQLSLLSVAKPEGLGRALRL